MRHVTNKNIWICYFVDFRGTTYVLYGTVDKTNNTLSINLNSNSSVDIGNREYNF
ncbi:hypothetical protein [Niastella populi]|uniref:hypothetical protein n=1 Tax=Niastella populi TaxID=550983 RepID=UPI0013FDD421|nr:hypothetical protein [Niastella populi]